MVLVIVQAPILYLESRTPWFQECSSIQWYDTAKPENLQLPGLSIEADCTAFWVHVDYGTTYVELQ